MWSRPAPAARTGKSQTWNMGMARQSRHKPGLHDQAWHYLLGRVREANSGGLVIVASGGLTAGLDPDTKCLPARGLRHTIRTRRAGASPTSRLGAAASYSLL